MQLPHWMTDLFISQAFAQTPNAAPPSKVASLLQSPLPFFVAAFFIIYFMMIRPQKRQQQQRQQMISNIKKGDVIVTSSGMYGKIYAIADKFLTVEIADNVRIRLDREAIATVLPENS